jgi:hypothetical protein
MNQAIGKMRQWRSCAAGLFLMLSASALATDRWTALAMIESGGRDGAVGRQGEISRYQIRPELWRGGNRLDAGVALANAQRIMSARVAGFERANGRVPSDFEFYVLWNAPAQIKHPHRAVVERARRFVNLTADAGYALRQSSSAHTTKRNS